MIVADRGALECVENTTLASAGQALAGKAEFASGRERLAIFEKGDIEDGENANGEVGDAGMRPASDWIGDATGGDGIATCWSSLDASLSPCAA